jgi:Zn-dependent peptidase ImmA (M78 family)
MNKLTGVKADAAYSHKKLEAIADYVRKGLNFGLTEAIDPLRLFEDLHEISITDAGRVIIPLRGHVTELETSEGYARYDSGKRCIEVVASSATYEWLEEAHPRAGFFVAHELGHCLLHTNQLMRLAQMPTNQQAAFHRGLTNHKPYEDTEWQANGFAGALLMPARGLAEMERRYGRLSTILIQDVFRVSGQAADYRLQSFQSRRHELLAI